MSQNHTKLMWNENFYPWIDTRLSEEELIFLNHAISEENKENISKSLAGNISKSEQIKDKDDWLWNTVFKHITEKMFYRDWDTYYKYHIIQEDPLPKFEMPGLWVNYQKQHEFNPIHAHTGLFSFVIFVKIPTHWKEQHALPFSVESNTPVASDFQFVWSRKNEQDCCTHSFSLSPEDEGRMLFFPAGLHHQVHPFYGTEEERITVSGNIDFLFYPPAYAQPELYIYKREEGDTETSKETQEIARLKTKKREEEYGGKKREEEEKRRKKARDRQGKE